MQTTYGLGSDMRGGGRFGPGLMSSGQDQMQTGTQLLGQAADAETTRNMGNDRREAERTAGNAQLGASVGTAAGMYVGMTYGAKLGAAAGPWGALAGGLVGALTSRLF